MNKLTRGDLPYEAVEEHLEMVLPKARHTYGIAIAFESGVSGRGVGLFAPYYHRAENGEFVLDYIEDAYDYTNADDPAAIWYVQSANDTKPSWHNLFGKATQSSSIIYAEPFFIDETKSQIAGVVMAVVMGDDLVDGGWRVDLGDSGYIALADADRRVVGHPELELTILRNARFSGPGWDRRRCKLRSPSYEA